MNYLGSIELKSYKKKAFLCSQKFVAGAVLKSYDWAIEQREKGVCVVCGCHSPLEKDVFKYLLKGTQPIILVLARGLKKRIEPELLPHIDKGRLLIISPFENSVTRVTKETALKRNKYILDLADEIVIGYASPNGSLKTILSTIKDKPITYLYQD